MVIRNIHTGKLFPSTKEKWDKFSPKYKKSFEVVDSTDKEPAKEIKVTPELKDAKQHGEKKKVEKPKTGEKK